MRLHDSVFVRGETQTWEESLTVVVGAVEAARLSV